MCCRQSLHNSFEVAAENLSRTAQLTLSGPSVRQIVEQQGRGVLADQRSGAVRPNFTTADCTAQTLISGADGVMVPLVSERQKQKRRTTEKARREQDGRRSTAKRGRPQRGSDGDYQEIKIVPSCDPDKTHQHVAGTAGDHQSLGRLMRRDAGRLKFNEAKTKYAVSDGAVWIARQYQQNLPTLDEHILDYYHLREHVIAASMVLYEEGSKQARDWVEDMMGYVWNQGSLVMLDRLGPYLRRHRTGAKHEALRSLRDYVGKRIDMTDYPSFRQAGYDCGSGPTESCCGTLTARLKGPGMRWDADNAEAVMALAGLYHSNLWQTYWKAQRIAA
jgi:hypothetical protein